MRKQTNTSNVLRYVYKYIGIEISCISQSSIFNWVYFCNFNEASGNLVYMQYLVYVSYVLQIIHEVCLNICCAIRLIWYFFSHQFLNLFVFKFAYWCIFPVTCNVMIPELTKTTMNRCRQVERALNKEQMGQGAQINYKGLQYCYYQSLLEGARLLCLQIKPEIQNRENCVNFLKSENLLLLNIKYYNMLNFFPQACGMTLTVVLPINLYVKNITVLLIQHYLLHCLLEDVQKVGFFLTTRYVNKHLQ